MSGTTTRLGQIRSRISTSLLAPLGILLTIPLLVAGVGLFIAFTSYRGICETVDAVAKQSFTEQSQALGSQVAKTLSQADMLMPVVQRSIRGGLLEQNEQDIARHLAELIAAREGLAYISLSQPNGDYRHINVRPDGEVTYVTRLFQPDGKNKEDTYVLSDKHELLNTRSRPDCGYDPRKRPFYPVGEAAQPYAWTQPYPFFATGMPGITCTGPVRNAQGELLVVVTIDFDFGTLSQFLEGHNKVPYGQVFLFTDQKQLLAHPGVRKEYKQDQDGSGELPKLTDLNDPQLATFGDHHPPPAEIDEITHFRFDSGDKGFYGSVMPYTVPYGPTWYVGSLAPRDSFIGDAADDLMTSIWVSVLGLGIAIGIAVLFARHLVANRRAVRVARAEAEAARDEAKQLGSYDLMTKLGEGGMGEVWVGEHRMLARPAAVKLILRQNLARSADASDSETVARFEREARAIATLRSVNTIQIYDYGSSADGKLYYVMELLDGIDLEELVEHHGAQPPARVVHILQQVCNSLAEAHDQGLVHRDIKPANIFICQLADDLDVVKVLDFGMVRQVEEGKDARLTMADMVVGTPAYMAPEQAQGDEKSGHLVDIYALGCVAYWLLTGQLVFDGRSAMDILMSHVGDTPDPVDKRARQHIPDALADLVMQCLEKDPKRRPADARELRSELLAIAQELELDWSRCDRSDWWCKHFTSKLPESSARRSAIQHMECAERRRRATEAAQTEELSSV